MAKNIPFDLVKDRIPPYKETPKERQKRLFSSEQPGITPLHTDAVSKPKGRPSGPKTP